MSGIVLGSGKTNKLITNLCPLGASEESEIVKKEEK